MHSFQRVAPPFRLFSGPDSLGQLSRELGRANSRRAMIVCGGSLVRNARRLDPIRHAVGERCVGAGALIDAVEALRRGLFLPTSLRVAGVPQHDPLAIARIGLRAWLLRGTPRRIRAATDRPRLLDVAWLSGR